MTSERSARPGECASIVIAVGLIGAERSVMAGLPCDECGARMRGSMGIAGGTFRHACDGVAHPLHVVVMRVLADVAYIEDDRFLAEVLPPVRGAGDLGADVAGLVHDRIDAVGSVFDDLALLHEDQGRAVVMAVPGHDAAGLDGQLAEAQLAAFDMRRLFAEVDGAERDVGDADRLVVDHLLRVRLDLVGRAFAGGDWLRRECQYAEDGQAGPDRTRQCVMLEHRDVSCVGRNRDGRRLCRDFRREDARSEMLFRSRCDRPALSGPIRARYRTDWGSAFPLPERVAFDGRAPDWRAFTSFRRSIS